MPPRPCICKREGASSWILPNPLCSSMAREGEVYPCAGVQLHVPWCAMGMGCAAIQALTRSAVQGFIAQGEGEHEAVRASSLPGSRRFCCCRDFLICADFNLIYEAEGFSFSLSLL